MHYLDALDYLENHYFDKCIRLPEYTKFVLVIEAVENSQFLMKNENKVMGNEDLCHLPYIFEVHPTTSYHRN